MPTSQKVKLGRNQVLTLDGVALLGIREVDLQIDSRTTDITAWNSQFASTLPVVFDATVRLLIYWKEDWDKIASKLFDAPQPVTLGISNAFTIRCVPVSVRVMQPIEGVLAWDVSLKAYGYQ